MSPSAIRANIQRKSARLSRLLTFLWIALAGTLLFERFGALALSFVRDPAEVEHRRFVLQLVSACPEVLYLLALWGIRQAMVAVAEGDLYAAALTRMVDRVGALLAAGALIGVFVVPSISRMVGSDPGYLIAFDVSGLVLGALGLSLKVFARLFQHAGAIQTELEEIF